MFRFPLTGCLLTLATTTPDQRHYCFAIILAAIGLSISLRLHTLSAATGLPNEPFAMLAPHFENFDAL